MGSDDRLPEFESQFEHSCAWQIPYIFGVLDSASVKWVY